VVAQHKAQWSHHRPSKEVFGTCPHRTINGVKTNLQERIPRLLKTRQAAEMLGRSPNTLKRWRYEGIGPDYVKIQGRVSYDVAVLLEFIRQSTRTPSVRAAMEDSRGAL